MQLQFGSTPLAPEPPARTCCPCGPIQAVAAAAPRHVATAAATMSTVPRVGQKIWEATIHAG